MSCEFGCANQMQGRFNKLSAKFKKLSDEVEKDALLYKFDPEKFEALKKGYKEAVTFVRAEERKLKKDEGLKDLDAKDKSEFLAAQSHHGIFSLSHHISKILDEVYDYQGVKKQIKGMKAPEEPKEDAKDDEKEKFDKAKEDMEKVKGFVDDIDKEIVKLCKYDEARCDSWKKIEEDKEKAAKKEKEAEAKLEELKGTEKDPDLKMGPGGPIPRSEEEKKEEKVLAEEKKMIKEAKKAEAKATGKKEEETDCIECAREERKKKEKITKYVNERYDVKFKDIQNATKGYNVWGGGAGEAHIPNPTVTKAEKKIINGRDPDEDINNAAKNAKIGIVYKKGKGSDDSSLSYDQKVAEEKAAKDRADEIIKNERESTVPVGKAPKSPEDAKKEQKEADEAAKEEIAEAKKSGESAVSKNPEPAKFIGVASVKVQ